MNISIFKKIWEWINCISPETRNILIILLLGYIFYSQIDQSIKKMIVNHFEKSIIDDKRAEQYTQKTAVEINRQIRLIAEEDQDVQNVLLLSYHNNTQSLQGYKYLYLSCLAEAPRSLDTPLLKSQWNNIDYIYYADELSKIHSQSFVQIPDMENMKYSLPKLYHLVKSSEAKSVSFFTIEGKESAIGMVVIFYKESEEHKINKAILPSIQKLAILLDYDNYELLRQS